MDDNHDTYKTANIKINQLFLNAWLSNEFSNFSLLVKYMSLNALNRIRSPHLLALLRQSSRSYMLALELMTKCTTAIPPLSLFYIFP
jgi:hypothetical protein